MGGPGTAAAPGDRLSEAAVDKAGPSSLEDKIKDLLKGDNKEFLKKLDVPEREIENLGEPYKTQLKKHKEQWEKVKEQDLVKNLESQHDMRKLKRLHTLLENIIADGKKREKKRTNQEVAEKKKDDNNEKRQKNR